VRGDYRILGGPRQLVESFVAAPGPMGWRYVGRVRRADALDEALIVDYAVDARWNLVRFRALDDRGNEAVAVPGEDGLQVAVRRSDGSERTWAFEGATAVWSPSPCSLLLVDRLLGRREGSLEAVRLEPPDWVPEQWTIRLEGRGRELDVIVDGRRLEVRRGPEQPISAEGWFELEA